MASFSTRARYLGSCMFATLIFIWTLDQHTPVIYQIVPALNSEHGSSLSWSRLIQQPYGFIFFFSPVLLAIATGLLSLSLENVSHIFRPANLKRLRAAGGCLAIACATSHFEPLIYSWLAHTDSHMPTFIEPALFLLCLLGGWIAVLAQQGETLLKQNIKLRSDLDDIV